MPVTPPATNNIINPSAQIIGDFKDILPLHIVHNHENTLIPVGTATAIVAITKYLRDLNDSPTVYIWCAHTTIPIIAIITIAIIIPIFPNTGFLENFDIISLIIPNAGNINTYTSGCPKNQNKC